jgi:hypothetical protein
MITQTELGIAMLLFTIAGIAYPVAIVLITLGVL